jgi:hypothetical protein
MRLYKSAAELKLMKRSAEIAAGAHRRAMEKCVPGMYEYQLEAEFQHEFIRHGARYPAYPPIIGGGKNACILHYRENDSLLKNGEMLAMAGIGDWITGVLQRDGADVASVVPKEGGIQFTESWSIGKGTKNADMAKKFIQYMMSPDGQVHSARMAAYPAFCVTKGGRALLNEKDPKEAQRTGQIDGVPNDPVVLIKEGRIKYRGLPIQQSLEEWNDVWSEYKGA